MARALGFVCVCGLGLFVLAGLAVQMPTELPASGGVSAVSDIADLWAESVIVEAEAARLVSLPSFEVPGVGKVRDYGHDVSKHKQEAVTVRTYFQSGGLYKRFDCKDKDVIILTAEVEGKTYLALIGLSSRLWITSFMPSRGWAYIEDMLRSTKCHKHPGGMNPA